MKQSSIIGKVTIFAALLFAGNFSHAAGWTPALTVTEAFTENSDLIVIYTSDGGGYTSGCAANSWIFVADNDARRGRAYATVLAAIATGKKLQFWYADSCAVWGFHQATSVKLVN